MQTFPWLTTLIVAPLAAAAIVWLLPHGARKYVRQIAFVLSLVVLALGVAMCVGFNFDKAGEFQFEQIYSWIPAFKVSYAVSVNGIGLTLIMLSLFLVPLCLLAGWRDVDPTKGRKVQHYVALILVLEAFMVAVFAARDVFLFYVLFEAMLIPVYFLIGAFGGSQRRSAAMKFLLYSLVGGLIMLAAVIYLFTQSPDGEQGMLISNLVAHFAGAPMSVVAERLVFLGFFVAFAIKAPMFPVHTWLPDAAQNSTPATATLLVGVLDKVGTFGMLMLCLPLFPNASVWAAPVIIVLALVSIIYGALLAIGQKDLMRLIAYTSVSHFGFIVLGIFGFSLTATTGSAFYMINHGFSTAALFLIAGMIIQRRGSADISNFGGLQRAAPVLAGTFLVAGLSALSLPGLSTFISEFLVIVGTFEVNVAAGVVAAFGVVLAALYVLLTYQRIATGPVIDELKDTKDMSGREKWVVAPIILAMLVFGFYPKPVLDTVEPGSAEIAEQAAQVSADKEAGETTSSPPLGDASTAPANLIDEGSAS